MKSSVRNLVILNIFRPDEYKVFFFLQKQAKAEWPTASPFQWSQITCKFFHKSSGADPAGCAA